MPRLDRRASTAAAEAAADEKALARSMAITDTERIIRDLTRWWPELLANRQRHNRRPAPNSQPDEDTLRTRAEKERAAAQRDTAYRVDVARRLGQVPVPSIGESPAPGQVHVLDEIVLIEAAVLDLEEELRDHLDTPLVPDYEGPEYLPATRGKDGPRWRPVNEQRRAPTPRTRVLRKHRGAKMLDPNRHGATITHLGDRIDVFPQPALVTIDSDAGERERVRAALTFIRDHLAGITDDDVLEHTHAELYRARRSLRAAIGDVERYVPIPDIECPLCGSLSLVEDQHSETITCTANRPGRTTVCSCGAETCGCTRGERHSWHRDKGGFVLLGKMVGPRVRDATATARIIWTRRAVGRTVSSIVGVKPRCPIVSTIAYCVEHRETFRTPVDLDKHLAHVGVHTLARICPTHGPELRAFGLPPMLRRP